MGIFSFGKRPKPRPFGFVPRYYDKDKEELQARLSKYDPEKDSSELAKARIRSGFKYHSGVDQGAYRKGSRQSNIRLFIIIGVLMILTLMILRSDSIMKLIQGISGR